MTEKSGKRPIFKSSNPTTGVKYFEEGTVPRPDPENPNNVPTPEELPPAEPDEPPRPKPASPMYPTTKPPREDVPRGGVPTGDD